MPRRSRPAVLPAEEALLDNAVELTFPASDPVSVEHAFQSARRQGSTRAPAKAASARRRAPAGRTRDRVD